MKKILILVIVSLFIIPKVSANYTINIDDDIKIYSFDKKIWNIINKSKYGEEIKKILIQRITKILWKTEDEIYKIGNFKNYNLESFNEYAMIKVYRYLTYWDNIISKDQSIKVLENDFIRVISTAKNIFIGNNTVYLLYDNWSKLEMIEFFKIKPDEDTIDFINNNILEKEFRWKCKAILNTKNYISFTKDNVYSIFSNQIDMSTESYQIDDDCWKYWTYRAINYFERKSDNLLIYVNAWQDFNWLDFSSIEVK